MNIRRSKASTNILLIGYFIMISLLVYSFVYYGYRYIIDSDELYHTQITYLISQGLNPYKDIYMTVYTPIFQWVLLPLFTVFGYSFDTIFIARLFMVIILSIRTIMGSLILFELFGILPALLFPLLSLTDPFTQVTSIQIRPDNIMLVLFTAGVYALIRAFKHKHIPLLFAISGGLLALSALTLLKIVPAAAIVCVISALFMLWKKQNRSLIAFCTGFLIVVSVFFGYFALTGRGNELYLELIAESFTSYSKFDYPVHYGFFYNPDNTTIFGYPGKPFTWYYLLSLPLFAFAGMYSVIISLVGKKHVDALDSMKFAILSGFITQWLFLFMMTSVFIQHYLVISFGFCLFTAIAFATFYQSIHDSRIRIFVTIIGIAVGMKLIYTGTTANLIRARSDARWVIAAHQRRWQQIPPGAVVFPNYLFRGLAYPVPYGYYIGNMPDEIKNRLPDIKTTLDEKKVPYLLMGAWNRRFVSPDTIKYIDTNYHFLPGEDELMVRNNL